jgi:histidine ammonia-lyase
MGATASRHFRQIVNNVETIIAGEALAAAQACDLAGRVPGGPLGALHARIRERVPLLERDDRVISRDVEIARQLLHEGGLNALEPEMVNDGQ